MERITTELYMIDDIMGVIIECPSNIVWSNQTGGTCCAHPEVEGIYVPLRIGTPPETDILYDIGYMEYDPKLVTQWLADNALDHFFEARKSFSDKYKTFGEAWVPVKIFGKEKVRLDPHLRPFAGMDAIITYTNSD